MISWVKAAYNKLFGPKGSYEVVRVNDLGKTELGTYKYEYILVKNSVELSQTVEFHTQKSIGKVRIYAEQQAAKLNQK